MVLLARCIDLQLPRQAVKWNVLDDSRGKVWAMLPIPGYAMMGGCGGADQLAYVRPDTELLLCRQLLMTHA